MSVFSNLDENGFPAQLGRNICSRNGGLANHLHLFTLQKLEVAVKNKMMWRLYCFYMIGSHECIDVKMKMLLII